MYHLSEMFVHQGADYCLEFIIPFQIDKCSYSFYLFYRINTWCWYPTISEYTVYPSQGTQKMQTSVCFNRCYNFFHVQL